MGSMTTSKRQKKQADGYLDKDLKKVSIFFHELRNDKSLPNFSDFLVECVLFGIGEEVNLKKMYPKQYMKVSTFLRKHNVRISALQKKK
jgi:hypothetical protein